MNRRPDAVPARQRLLAAAARVFARDGLSGATTRAIAREAGVNEVTLFRHFGTKDRLLAAVVGQNFGRRRGRASARPQGPTGDLRADLLELGRRYEKLLADNLPLVRTMLGEIQHHHRDQERKVFDGIFRPLKEALHARLQAAHRAGELRPDVRPDVLADLFGGMLFTGVLRRANGHIRLDYAPAAYLDAALNLVLRGCLREEAAP